MSNLNLTAQWHDNINQVDVTEPIVGGDGGNANLATRQLAENILWLKQQIGSVEAYKVGDIYTTTINHVSAAAVAAHHGYGTWARYAEGRTVVGQSTQAADPDDYKTMGNEFGANTHKLTVDEMPSHNHDNGAYNKLLRVWGGNTCGSFDSTYGEPDLSAGGHSNIQSNGGDQPHNNIQPSIVAGCWLRTA